MESNPPEASHPNGRLKIHAHPELSKATMVMGLSGWMDGGEVSTGTIEYLVEKLDAQPLAEIESEDFYIYNFPGSMEVSSLFRPQIKIEQGLVTQFNPPVNRFHFSKKNDLILFEGKEPSFNWSSYADCIFRVAAMTHVSMIYFIGSVGGMVPHTREPRLLSSVSHPRLKPDLETNGLGFTDYEGPGSIVSYMVARAEGRGLDMATVVAEIPPYVQGRNVKCIESMMRKLTGILGLPIDLEALRTLSDQLEKRLNKIVEQRPELVEHIRKLEEDYDNEVFDTQMGDLKAYLEQQGIRLD